MRELHRLGFDKIPYIHMYCTIRTSILILTKGRMLTVVNSTAQSRPFIGSFLLPRKYCRYTFQQQIILTTNLIFIFQLQKPDLTMMKVVLALLGLAATANAIELTLDNFDAETAGKTVLIKFLAPW